MILNARHGQLERAMSTSHGIQPFWNCFRPSIGPHRRQAERDGFPETAGRQVD
jgi:hypothetical protein